MPRKSRIVIPGHPQHIITRGVNREPIFYDEIDCRYYLGRLKEAIETHNCVLHAYVLMTNHVHLLITPNSEIGLGRSIQSVGRYYVQYFNEKYNRTGTLWEGRYKSSLVDTENYLLICYRYIELNPVRARMVSHPAEYCWSSYRHNALGQINPIITPHDKYRELGNEPDDQQAGYRALFKGHISEQQLKEIRNASNREWVLGNDEFKERIALRLQRQIAPLPRGGDRKSENYRRQHEINRH